MLRTRRVASRCVGILCWVALATTGCGRHWTPEEVEKLLNERERTRAHVPQYTITYRDCREAGPNDSTSAGAASDEYICQVRATPTGRGDHHACSVLMVQKVGLKISIYDDGVPVFSQHVLVNDDRTPSEIERAKAMLKNGPCGNAAHVPE